MKANTILLICLLAAPSLVTCSALHAKLKQAGIPAFSLAFYQTVNTDSVIVTIVSDDEFYVNKSSVAEGEIVAEVGRRLQNMPEDERNVYIKTAPEVSYGVFVRILDDLLSHGYERVGLVRNRTQGRTAVESVHEERASEANASERSGPQAASDETMLVVTVEAARGGQAILRIGAAPVSLQNLPGKIHALLSSRTVKIVNIQAPATIQYQSILPVVDAVKAGGTDTIKFSAKSP